ncbi:MAG: lytic polysaccharide monooxygenase [Actinomycetota bacterium]
MFLRSRHHGPRRRRSKITAFVLLTLALVMAQLTAVAPAGAHGAATEPGSRSYLCRLDGKSAGGDIIPNNPACAAAIAVGGKQQLWDWFGVLRGDGAGRTVGFIPDGQLCSGGNPAFKGLDLARADWPYTSLTSGSQITFRYNAWAAHPGEFRMYVTKDGYDPTQPLAWDDLEPVPFSTWDQTTPNARDDANGTPGYEWTATLPGGKSGPHVIYSVWERSDSAETFYNCSDVRFDGGNGQVIGVGAGGGTGQQGGTPTASTVGQTTTTPPSPTVTVAPTPTTPGVPATTATVPTAPMPTVPGGPGLGDGYWSTSGDALVDAGGDQVSIRGVNWFGFETASYMPHGLWTRNWEEMVDQIADLKFNTIRLPFSSALLDPGVTPNGINNAANPGLEGVTSLELMDDIIERAGEQGLKVVLDRHALGPDNRHRLWYDDTYSHERFIADWQLLAERYKGDPTVIGADLYNEPHDEACWGCGDPARDWRMAATEAGNAIHAINPGWLIFVEGVEEPDGAACDGPNSSPDCIWWGGNLLDAGSEPVTLATPNKVVYSPHEYATSVHRQPWFNDPAFPANLPGIWSKYWGYLEEQDIAPVMVGEFGTTLQAAEDEVWLRDLLAYMDANSIGFTFWTFNPNSGDTGGILLDDWRTVDQAKYSILEPYLLGPFDGTAVVPTPLPPPVSGTTPPTGGTTTPAAPPTLTPGVGSCSVTLDVNAWNTAYVAHLTITNTGDTTVDGWTLAWRFNEGENLQQWWGAEVSADGSGASAVNRTWNGLLAPGQSAQLGFIATHDGDYDSPLTGVTLNGTSCS